MRLRMSSVLNVALSRLRRICRRRKTALVGEWLKCEARLNLTRLEVGLLTHRLDITPSLVLPHLDPDDGYTP